MKDNITLQDLCGVRFKRLHGHTQIILKEKDTGVEELVADKDNLVTLAVPNIFDSNLGGTIPYMSLGPVRDMFGGVMCFGEQFETTALLPLAESVNPLIAHAGQTPHASASTKRGNPNGAGTHRTDTGEGYRFEWDFADNQGNGDINAVALCHKWGGDIALTPIAAEANETLIKTVTNGGVTFANNTSSRPAANDYLAACIVYDETDDTGYRVTSDGTVQKVRYNYKRDGLNYTVAEAVVIESHLVEDLETCHYIFFDNGAIYGVTIDADAHGFILSTVNMSTWEATNEAYPAASSVTLHKPDYITIARSICRLANITKSGNYLYLYADGLENFYKVDLTTKEFSILTAHTPDSWKVLTDTRYWGQISLAEGLVIGGNYIINGDDLYPSTQLPNVAVTGSGLTNAGRGVRGFVPLKKSPAFLAWGFDNPNSSYQQTWRLAVAFPTVYLATIQNLESTIEKRNNKTMKIIYTLTEVEENDQGADD